MNGYRKVTEGMNFQVDSFKRRYCLWWDGKAFDALTVRLLPVYEREEPQNTWEKKAVSADYHGWNEFPGSLGDGLYQAVIETNGGQRLYEKEIWIGPPGRVTVTVKEWEKKGFYKVQIISPIPLDGKDYCLKTMRRQHIRGMKLKKIFRNDYKGEFLLKLDDSSSFEVILSEEMKQRLGNVEIAFVSGG